MQRREIKIGRGLDLPLDGVADESIGDGHPARTVALLGPDYRSLKPTLKVSVGDRVQLGQPLFIDKQTPDVQFTSPAAGAVKAINRGARRSLMSVVIEIDGKDEKTFPHFDNDQLKSLEPEAVKSALLESGLWTALRKRPYGKIPDPNSEPAAVFITAMDTNPLAVDPADLISDHESDFTAGVTALSRVSPGPVYICCRPGAPVPESVSDLAQVVEFSGPHPAGLPGTHIHFLNPLGSESREVWYLDLQDVIAVGKLLLTGRLWTERIITLAGPMVSKPRRIRTRLGANVTDLIRDEIRGGSCRVISGSVLGGHEARDSMDYLGRYTRQVTALANGERRRFLGWLAPGFDRYSAINAFISRFTHRSAFSMSTTQNGSPRAMVPIGNFEKVMPLDVLPAPLLKSLIVRDTDAAQALGCMELDEEDLALCTFVCPSKYDYGGSLLEALAQIEKEG